MIAEPPVPPSSLQGSAARKAALSAVGALAALGLLVLAVGHWSPEGAQPAEVLARARVMPMLAALLVMTGGMWFMALRWRALMPGARRASAAALTAIECVGLLLNYALPGPVGEVAIAWMVHRRYGVTVSSALAAGVCSRVIGLSAAGVLALLARSQGDLPIPDDYQGLIGATTALIGLAAAALVGVAAFPSVLLRVAGRIPTRRPLLARLVGALRSLADALRSLRELDARAWSEAVLWAFCGHFSVAGGIALAAYALGLTPPFAGVLYTYCAATAGVVIVFALPGGQVGWDAMFCSFFMVTTATSAGDALAVTLIVRLQQMLLLGAGALAMPLFGEAVSGSPSLAPAERHP